VRGPEAVRRHRGLLAGRARRLAAPATGLSKTREVWEDIPPPRFVLERLIPPEVACLGWNAPTSKQAWIHHALTGEYLDQDGDRYSPRKPTGGYYEPLPLDYPRRITGGMIADHDGFCCKRAKKTDSVCYGWYVAPGAEHLAIIEQAVQAIKQRREHRPGIITAEEQAKAVNDAREGVEGYWGALQGRLSRRVLEALRTHAGLLSEDPTRQQWGKYMFTAGHSKSGATVEQINKWRKEKTHGTSSSGGGG